VALPVYGKALASCTLNTRLFLKFDDPPPAREGGEGEDWGSFVPGSTAFFNP